MADAATAVQTQIIRTYQFELADLRGRTGEMAGRAWDDLGSWRGGDIADFVDTVGPIVEAAQAQADDLTRSYLAMLGEEVTGHPASPAMLEGFPADYATIRGGAAVLADVYERPFHEVWSRLGDGHTVADAVGRGRVSVVRSADTDVMLAARQAAHDAIALDDRGVVGYRRVLTGARTCRFCATAATQRYHVADLLPLHHRCDCTVAPIWGSDDPGHVLNRDLLDRLKTDPDIDWIDQDGNPIGRPHVTDGGVEMGPTVDQTDLDWSPSRT